MINYQSPTISLGTDVAFNLRLRLKGSTVTVYTDGESISRAMSPEDVDLERVQDLSVRLRPHMSRQEIVPPFRIDLKGQRIVVEFPANRQRLGDWVAIIRFSLPSSEYADGKAQYTTTIPLCYVEDSSQIVAQQSIYHVDAYAWAISKGEPGDPKTLLPQVRDIVQQEVSEQSPALVRTEMAKLAPAAVSSAVGAVLPGVLQKQLPQAIAPRIAGAVEEALAADIAAKAASLVKIGGRNLVLNSRVEKRSSVYHVGTWRLSEDWVPDSQYTIALWCRCNTSTSQVIDLYPNGGFSRGGSITITGGESSQMFCCSFVCTSGKIEKGRERELRLYAVSNNRTNNAGIEYIIDRILLIQGNILPISWAPAPEDARSEYLLRYKEQHEVQNLSLQQSYAKIRPYNRLSGDARSRLMNLHVNYNGEQSKLSRAVEGAIALPTEERWSVVQASEGPYREAYGALRGALDEALLKTIDGSISSLEARIRALEAK